MYKRVRLKNVGENISIFPSPPPYKEISTEGSQENLSSRNQRIKIPGLEMQIFKTREPKSLA